MNDSISRSVRVFSFLALAAAGALSAGCGGGGKTAPVATPRCLRASDCSGTLTCTGGYCVAVCVQSKDCPSGQRCTITDDGNSCQPPEKRTCIYTSECISPLVCGGDMQCRNQCVTDVDCPKGQKCTTETKLCADPTQDKNYDPKTNDFKVASDAGIVATGGAGGGGGGAGGGAGGDMSPPDAGSSDAGVDAPTTTTDGGGADRASTDTGTPMNDASVSLDGPKVVVDGVVATPASVPQGLQMGISITVTRAAGGLAGAGSFDFGDLTARVDMVTDTQLVLRVTVPHAATLGKKTLRFGIASGVVTAADILEVTAITAGPAGLDTSIGSATAPFRTLKRAVQAASVGDTIHLLDGTYDVKGGEDWKNYLLPEDVTIVGDSTAMTIIDGTGATTTVNGLVSPAKMLVRNLTLTHFSNGVDIVKPASMVTLENVKLSGNQSYAVYLETAATGSTLTYSGANSVIEAPATYGIFVYANNAILNVSDGLFQAGNAAIYTYGSTTGSKVTVTNATLKQLATSGTDAINIGGAPTGTGSVVTLNKVTIIGSINIGDPKADVTIGGMSTITEMYADYGIQFAGTKLTISDTTITEMVNSYSAILFGGTSSTMSLKNVTITGGYYGIQQNGSGSTAKLRGTKISAPLYYSYYLTAGDLDLGTATEAGDNQFASPQNYACLYIARPAGGAGSGKAITSSTSSYNNKTPAAAESVNALSGAVTVAGYWYVGVGNQLTFY